MRDSAAISSLTERGLERWSARLGAGTAVVSAIDKIASARRTTLVIAPSLSPGAARSCRARVPKPILGEPRV